jgi:hypothetical protein
MYGPSGDQRSFGSTSMMMEAAISSSMRQNAITFSVREKARSGMRGARGRASESCVAVMADRNIHHWPTEASG